MDLRAKAERDHLTLSDKQLAQFAVYRQLLLSGNRKKDLTNITDRDEVDYKHFIDSLSLVRNLGPAFTGRTVDVGTGAGFPGIPLKIYYPDMPLLLVDSLQKRVDFLQEVIDALKLKDTIAVHARAEDFFSFGSEYRESFDLAISRAVAPLPTLLEYLLPGVKLGGRVIAMKGPKGLDELEESSHAIQELGGILAQADSFLWASGQFERVNIVVKKDRATPEKYPRSGAKARKRPL